MLYEPLLATTKNFLYELEPNAYFENTEMTDELYNYWFIISDVFEHFKK